MEISKNEYWDYELSEALVVENKIVYFGPDKDATIVLEEKEEPKERKGNGQSLHLVGGY